MESSEPETCSKNDYDETLNSSSKESISESRSQVIRTKEQESESVIKSAKQNENRIKSEEHDENQIRSPESAINFNLNDSKFKEYNNSVVIQDHIHTKEDSFISSVSNVSEKVNTN